VFEDEAAILVSTGLCRREFDEKAGELDNEG
jgi:hypothetical protein